MFRRNPDVWALVLIVPVLMLASYGSGLAYLPSLEPIHTRLLIYPDHLSHVLDVLCNLITGLAQIR